MGLGARMGFLCPVDQSFPTVALLTFGASFVGMMWVWDGCLAASLDSAQQMSVMSPTPPIVTANNVSRPFKCPGGRGEGGKSPPPPLRTATVHVGWCPGVVSVPQNYVLNDQARTVVFTSANPKDSNKTEQRQELNVLKFISSQINIRNNSKLKMACGLCPFVFRPTEKPD